MGLLRRKHGYDRRRILEAAGRARARGRHRKAIALYRQVLTFEPREPELHARLAPLLARTGQDCDAWSSYQLTARALLRDKRHDSALTVYRDATRRLPRQIEAWQRAAGLEQRLGRDREALETLLEGRRQFRTRRLRPQAIALLRSAREIEPWAPEPVLDLARLLTRSAQEFEARRLLEQLAERCDTATLRRVRATQWRASPSLVNTWNWLSALLGRGERNDTRLARVGAAGR